MAVKPEFFPIGPPLRHFAPFVLFFLATFPFSSFARADEERSADETVTFHFSSTPWPDVLTWLAKELDLTLQMNDAPGGKFTYSDPNRYSKDEAFEIVHRSLLDRGFTLVRKNNLLLVVLLADNLHWDLAPFVPVDQLKNQPATRIVTTTLKLHSLPGGEAATELGPTLSPRGKLVGIGAGGRLAVCDQAGAILQLIDLLAVVDPPSDARATRLKVFLLKHADTKTAETMIRDMLGPESKASDSGDPLSEFQNMGRTLFNSKTLGSFVPGMSLDAIAATPPKVVVPTRIARDEHRNAILVTASPDNLALISKVVAALDVPERFRFGSDAETSIRRYPIPQKNAPDVASQLRALFAKEVGFYVGGNADSLIVRGTAEQHERVEKILARLARSETQLAVFSMPERDIESLALQLDRLFEISGQKNKPTFVADVFGKNLLVRGTSQQIEEVRRFLADFRYDPLKPARTTPDRSIPARVPTSP
ncbi:MAG: secretin N-terminal domain-containing protein [Planctomycetota bacterium]